jgi:hypothetical protein
MSDTVVITAHGALRMSQRGIGTSDIDMIMLIGTEVEGGYLVREQDYLAFERIAASDVGSCAACAIVTSHRGQARPRRCEGVRCAARTTNHRKFRPAGIACSTSWRSRARPAGGRG